MAFIWKDTKSGSWYLDFTPSGGKRTRKRIGKSKQAATLALKEVEYQLSFDRAGVSTPDMTLKDFFEKYTLAIQPHLRPKSWKRYRAIIDHFRAFIGPKWEKMKLQQLNREQFEQYIAWRREGNGAFPGKNGNNGTPAKTKTINTELDMLASMFNKAVEWRYLARNPAKSLSRLKEDDRRAFRFFSTEEIELLRLVADLLDQQAPLKKIQQSVNRFYKKHKEMDAERDIYLSVDKKGGASSDKTQARLDQPIKGWLRNGRLIVDFLLTTGSRENEILELVWSCLDLKRGVVSYRRRKDWVPKGTERDIALKPDIVQSLKALERIPGQPHVFLDWTDKPIPPRTFERGIRKLIQLARLLHATLHDFRHTFASHLAMAGIPLPTIQQLLGHKDIQTVMIYAHLSPTHIQRSVAALPF